MEKFLILFIYQLYANQATWTTTNDLMIKLKQLGSSWISKSVEKNKSTRNVCQTRQAFVYNTKCSSIQ